MTTDQLLAEMGDRVARTINKDNRYVYLARMQDEMKGIAKQIRNQKDKEAELRQQQSDRRQNEGHLRAQGILGQYNQATRNLFFQRSMPFLLKPKSNPLTQPPSDSVQQKQQPSASADTSLSFDQPNQSFRRVSPNTSQTSNSSLLCASPRSKGTPVAPVAKDAFASGPLPHNNFGEEDDNVFLSVNTAQDFSRNVTLGRSGASNSNMTIRIDNSIAENRSISIEDLVKLLSARKYVNRRDLTEDERKMVDTNAQIFRVECEAPGIERVSLMESLPKELENSGGNLRGPLESDFMWMNDIKTRCSLTQESYQMANIGENANQEKYLFVSDSLRDYFKKNGKKPISSLRIGVECVGLIHGQYARLVVLGPSDLGKVRCSTLDNFTCISMLPSDLFEMPPDFSAFSLPSNAYFVRLRGIESVPVRKQSKVTTKLAMLNELPPLRATVCFGKDAKHDDICVVDLVMEEEQMYLSDLLVAKKLAIPLETDPKQPSIDFALKHFEDQKRQVLNESMMNGYIEAEVEADAQVKTGGTLTHSLGLNMALEGGEVQLKDRGDSADGQTLARRQPNAADTDDTLTADEQACQLPVVDENTDVAEQVMKEMGKLMLDDKYDNWAVWLSLHEFCKAMTMNAKDDGEKWKWAKTAKFLRETLDADRDREEEDEAEGQRDCLTD
ncbi:hypothetical protein WR25_24221 isoform B [Diploscapter pachys]|uniref:Tudor domain-containing protein n=1 Tax=Diploscapter pachys TaxID=2018661 RepID=A0A2A2LL92_9BILA|nr:hypothetical protein WR25_24221 isoform B [Diploscapter pachys]